MVSALSGFSGPIIPSDSVTYVSKVLQNTNPSISPDQIRTAWAKVDASQLAKIYSAVFGATQKEDVDLVSITGTMGSIIVASSLLWLLDGQAELVVDGLVSSTVKTPRLSIHVRTVDQDSDARGSWVVEEWREAISVTKMVVFSNVSEATGNSLSLTNFVPAITAKQVLRAQFDLSESEMMEVGRIATALVIVSIEEGFVTHDSRRPGATPHEVRLKDFCQSSYRSKEMECLKPFGWEPSDINGAIELAEALKEWTAEAYPGLEDQDLDRPHALNGKPIDQVIWIIGYVEKLQQSKTGTLAQDPRREVLEAAVYVAAQSLYMSICCHFPDKHFFKIPNFRSMTSAGSCMLHWIIRHESLRGQTDLLARPVVKRTGLMRLIDVTTLDRLRTSCMASLLPGAEDEDGGGDMINSSSGIHRRDLAFASNGFVAVLAQLHKLSTSSQDAMAVEFRSGYLYFDGGESLRTSNYHKDPS